MFKILIVLVAFTSSYYICNGAQSELVNFWYTCDFQMETELNDMSEECRKIYSQKAAKSDVYELYKIEAEMFYKFRNKLVECESNGKTCALSDNQSELEMPLVS
uniref:cGMP-specific 3',5'-cyclic phosphodiesterase n=1 Tax=Zeugodacus cucurbitae TaxID=28588 RepID=A0A0A1WT03_ZEUCU